jgi:hypothetical protein
MPYLISAPPVVSHPVSVMDPRTSVRIVLEDTASQVRSVSASARSPDPGEGLLFGWTWRERDPARETDVRRIRDFSWDQCCGSAP